MPVSKFHGQVATIALRAAAPHGFALGGGNALIAHGVIDRFTQDVDVFSDEEGGVEAASDAVEAALREAGFGTERRDKAGGLGDIFYGLGEGMAEWIVTAPGGEQMMLQMAYFDRARRPVIMEFGPVLDLEDVVGGKVCALASRVEPRDFVDTAAALERYTVEQIIGFARRLDPGLTDRDFAEAVERLDMWGDGVFASFGLGSADIAEVRARFAAWPRTRSRLHASLAGRGPPCPTPATGGGRRSS
jgi:Nucleotidyl transferase AbiEii toxin, Type IV TA system